MNHEFGPALFNDSTSASNTNSEVKNVETETMNIIDMMNQRMNSSSTSNMMAQRGGMRPNNRMRGPPHRNFGGDAKDGNKQSYRSQRGDPPPGYVCHRCHVSGHWIQDCPTNGDPKYDKKNRQRMGAQLPGL